MRLKPISNSTLLIYPMCVHRESLIDIGEQPRWLYSEDLSTEHLKVLGRETGGVGESRAMATIGR